MARGLTVYEKDIIMKDQNRIISRELLYKLCSGFSNNYYLQNGLISVSSEFDLHSVFHNSNLRIHGISLGNLESGWVGMAGGG